MFGNRRTAGFTLFEVVVAITLASFIAAAAHGVFTAMLDGRARAAMAQTELHKRSNASRLLTALVGSLDVDPEQPHRFRGLPGEVSFTTWYEDERGYIARGQIRVAVVRDSLLLYGLNGSPVLLADSVLEFGLDYLLEPGDHARWVRRWISRSSAPHAIRVRMIRRGRADTLLVIAGARG